MTMQNQQKQETNDGVSSFLEKELEERTDRTDDGDVGSFLEDKLDKSRKSSSSASVNYQPQIHFKSSEDMSELKDESIELIVTSPPYNTDWNYGSVDDDLNYATEYLPKLSRVFLECYRVLRPGGRMCVNVPSLLRSGASGGYPISADIQRLLANGDGVSLAFEKEEFNGREDINKLKTDTDWVIREQIAWVKPFNHDGLAPNGSFPRPWGILLNNMHEVVVIFQKPGDRDYDEMDEERIEESHINKDSDTMCDDVWEIQPDSWSPEYVEGEDIPVFPDKLVRRCINLWTYKDDTVLDPFAGRFTVGKVAKEEKRYSVGYELREELDEDIREYTRMEQMGLSQF